MAVGIREGGPATPLAGLGAKHIVVGDVIFPAMVQQIVRSGKWKESEPTHV